MKLNKYLALMALILMMFVGIQLGHSQPPPPPPPDLPPCWPPPCMPVDNGILFAIFGGVLFGAYAIFQSLKSRVTE